jgi:multidrug resistance efflux pump
VTSRNTQVVAAQSDGPVLKVLVHQGQYVHKDDLLASIDTTQLETDLHAREADKASAGASAAEGGARASQANRQAGMYRRLMYTGAAAPAEFKRMQSEASAASAAAGAAYARAKGAQVEIDRINRLIAAASVKAPLDGYVSAVRVKVGGAVHRGEPILQVFDPKQMMIRFAVPNDTKIKPFPGQVIEMKVEGDERPIYATITRVSEETDPTIDFKTVDADIDETKLRHEVTVGSKGRARIAERQQPAGGVL